MQIQGKGSCKRFSLFVEKAWKLMIYFFVTSMTFSTLRCLRSTIQ